MNRFPIRTRVLHWLTAVAVFAALLIGFTMTNEIGSHGALVAVHMTLGISILVIVIARAANRFTHKPPKWPDTVGPLEGKLIAGSELAMYAMLLVQPLVGWVMDLAWKGESLAGVRIYDLAAWRGGVMVVTVCAALGALSSWWIVETRCRNIWQPR